MEALSRIGFSLDGTGGVDAKTDGDDGVEVVELRVVAFSVGGSCPKFPDNCILLLLPARKQVA